jgi:5-methylcytosine-specific restriction protein A
MLKPTLRPISLSIAGSRLSGATKQERERSRDAQRRSQQPWRAWYKLEIWDHPETGLRIQQLRRKPICEACGRATATIVHHKRPHRGVWELFAAPNNLQSVCKPCHDGEIQRGERAGKPAAS